MTNSFLYKVNRKLIGQRVGNLWRFSPPYEYVQNITEYNLFRFLGITQSEIKSWCIVGGYLGNEIPTILRNYPNVRVNVFECSRRYAGALKRRFAKSERVSVIEKAVSNSQGRLKFFETTLKGGGSLLKVGSLARQNYGAEEAEAFEVESVTLDEALDGLGVDLLQLDVQGAERLVLEGATKVLETTRAVFTEVSLQSGLYENATTLSEIRTLLEGKGFELALLGLGTDLTGNALFIRCKNKA